MLRLMYGVIDGYSGEFSCACAGHTPPLFLPRLGTPELWRNVGPLLGPVDASFPVQRVQLQAGDRVLFYTDGLHGTGPEQADDLMAVAQARNDLVLPALVERLTLDLLERTAEPDDFTLLGVEFL